MIGKKISHYSVTEKLGAGGMGEVYRATDTKLGRDVALKVLPEEFAKDSDRMARFKREAQVLASLNHPNIASIYGLEEDNGTHALVLELVEGPTLSDRLRDGAVPVREALTIAEQIAEALEAAHERGVVHRDLKPANVKIRHDGTVKVLDFGLAKALEGIDTGEYLADSATLDVAGTRAGVILGTAAYMAPEQAKGAKVDRRADVWAFGVVLFEMLAGRHPHRTDNFADTLASVIMKEPDWEALPADTPPPVASLLNRCLAKDPRDRLQAIGEARYALEEYLADRLSGSTLVAPHTAAPEPVWRRSMPWVAGVLGVVALVALVSLWRGGRPLPQPVMRFAVPLPAKQRLGGLHLTSFALSRDGSRLVYVGSGDSERQQLYIRPIDQLEVTRLPGTEGAEIPFFSPDGEWVGFFAEGKLKKVSVQGGPPVTLCDANGPRGGSWGPDDTILFTAFRPTNGLSRISASGGSPEEILIPDPEKNELGARWPEILPDGKTVLFTFREMGDPNFNDADIAAFSLESGEWKVLIKGGTFGRYLPTGHIAFLRDGTLFVASFDASRMEVTGPAVPMVEEVQSDLVYGSGQFAISSTGTMIYLSGNADSPGTLVWSDLKGNRRPMFDTPRRYRLPRFSPDGKRLAVQVNGANTDVWILEIDRAVLRRFTYAQETDSIPVWTPDGRKIVFQSNREGGRANLFWKAADGASEAERLTTSDRTQIPFSWTPDGKVLAFFARSPKTGFDIWTMRLDRDDEPTPFEQTPLTELEPEFSPDGRWLAYMSNETGRHEIYVEPFPGPGRKWQVSTEGGTAPRWSPDGRELYYVNEDRMMAASVRMTPSFNPAKPRLLFEGRFGFGFDVAPDGKNFVLIQPSDEDTGPRQLHVVLNWYDEVRRAVPRGGN